MHEAARHWRLDGHQALTWIDDRAGNGRVQYITWVQSESTRVSIAVQAEAADFDQVRKRVQPILDSFRMP